jgi:hypothetical protein
MYVFKGKNLSESFSAETTIRKIGTWCALRCDVLRYTLSQPATWHACSFRTLAHAALPSPLVQLAHMHCALFFGPAAAAEALATLRAGFALATSPGSSLTLESATGGSGTGDFSGIVVKDEGAMDGLYGFQIVAGGYCAA